MAKLINRDDVAKHNGITQNGKPDLDLGEKILNSGYDQAVIEAKRILGTTRYDEVVALGASTEERQTLLQALAVLSYFAAFPILNLRLSSNGGFVRSIGLTESATELMSRRELEGYRSTLFAKAKLLLETLHVSTALRPYQTGPDDDVVFVL